MFDWHASPIQTRVTPKKALTILYILNFSSLSLQAPVRNLPESSYHDYLGQENQQAQDMQDGHHNFAHLDLNEPVTNIPQEHWASQTQYDSYSGQSHQSQLHPHYSDKYGATYLFPSLDQDGSQGNRGHFIGSSLSQPAGHAMQSRQPWQEGELSPHHTSTSSDNPQGVDLIPLHEPTSYSNDEDIPHSTSVDVISDGSQGPSEGRQPMNLQDAAKFERDFKVLYRVFITPQMTSTQVEEVTSRSSSVDHDHLVKQAKELERFLTFLGREPVFIDEVLRQRASRYEINPEELLSRDPRSVPPELTFAQLAERRDVLKKSKKWIIWCEDLMRRAMAKAIRDRIAPWFFQSAEQFAVSLRENFGGRWKSSKPNTFQTELLRRWGANEDYQDSALAAQYVLNKHDSNFAQEPKEKNKRKKKRRSNVGTNQSQINTNFSERQDGSSLRSSYMAWALQQKGIELTNDPADFEEATRAIPGIGAVKDSSEMSLILDSYLHSQNVSPDFIRAVQGQRSAYLAALRDQMYTGENTQRTLEYEHAADYQRYKGSVQPYQHQAHVQYVPQLGADMYGVRSSDVASQHLAGSSTSAFAPSHYFGGAMMHTNHFVQDPRRQGHGQENCYRGQHASSSTQDNSQQYNLHPSHWH